MVRIIILGAAGIMGRLISKLALEDNEIQVVAACDVSNIGVDLSNLAGTTVSSKVKISNVSDLQKIIKESKPEVAIDFSIAKATESNCTTCVKNGLRCVIGTTGLSKEFLENFKKLVIEYKAPAVISSNMATGVNILFKIASLLAIYLSEWDIEVIEAHHNRKRDNYSGTSLTILSKICEALGVKEENVAQFGRSKGVALRKKGATNEIGIHCIRAGDIVGNHTVLYAGPGEYIELTHKAISRNCFAEGAIRAIKFISKQTENRIYTTEDVLSLK